MTMFAAGRQPRTDVSDWAEWRRREFNNVADHLCNLTTDLQKEIFEISGERMRAAIQSKSNLQLYTDGGFRSDEMAASAWALFACNSDGTTTWIARGSLLLSSCRSSFGAECIALDIGINYLLQFIT
mmetsp:Transcript_94605/g.167556  ORF Transcript_94605/g.167556 Transcript_94605/m.167556 type:complete len:127 (+) Transcript_94605:140-520(+)